MDRLLMPLLETMHFRSAKPRPVLLVGPRGCGKTTLVKALQKRRGTPEAYADWSDLSYRANSGINPFSFLDLSQSLLFNRTLAAVEEIHEFPCWEYHLKNAINRRDLKFDIIATSCVDVKLSNKYKKRYGNLFRKLSMHPLCLSEIIKSGFLPKKDYPQTIIKSITEAPPNPGRRGWEGFEALLRFGGFPEPFYAQDEKRHWAWLKHGLDRLVRRDLGHASRIQMLASVEQLVMLLLSDATQIFSINRLRSTLRANIASVRLWLRWLERMHFCFRISPHPGRLERTLRHAPKFYLRDWSAIKDSQRRFENLVACALLRWCDFAADWQQRRLTLHYVRDKEKRQADFLLTLDKKPFLLVGTTIEESGRVGDLRYFSERLGRVPAVQVSSSRRSPGEENGVKLLPAPAFLAAIP
ncbi:MAG: AAA family ATPase [Elusimicrobia bacterium]|nr:AAA family ATPase [Elusimicrobiota bacterium]